MVTWAKLFCRTGDLAGTDHLITQRDTTIGRDPHNSIVIPRKVISLSHARIWLDPATNGFMVEDLGSRNGTKLDGHRLSHPEPLSSLNVVTLAERYDFIFQALVQPEERAGATSDSPPAQATDSGSSKTQPQGVRKPPPALAGRPADAGSTTAVGQRASGPPQGLSRPSATTRLTSSAPGAPSLPGPLAKLAHERSARLRCEVRVGSNPPSAHLLAAGRHVMGRAIDCTIRIDDETVADRHAELVVDGDRITVVALEDTAGLSVNGVAATSECLIRRGDQVTIGKQTVLTLI